MVSEKKAANFVVIKELHKIYTKRCRNAGNIRYRADFRTSEFIVNAFTLGKQSSRILAARKTIQPLTACGINCTGIYGNIQLNIIFVLLYKLIIQVC